MYPVAVFGVIGLMVVWLFFLSVVFWKQFGQKRRLRPQGEGRVELEGKVLDILDSLDGIRDREKVIFKTLRGLADDGMHAICKLAVLRYNPYDEVGGDQSFTVAMLNNLDTGLILTSLHNRSGTRVYTKLVDVGKAATALSEEEEKTLKQAKDQYK